MEPGTGLSESGNKHTTGIISAPITPNRGFTGHGVEELTATVVNGIVRSCGSAVQG